MIKIPLFSKPGVIHNPFIGSLTQAWGILIPFLFLVIPIFKLGEICKYRKQFGHYRST